jgi:hypothetical protein
MRRPGMVSPALAKFAGDPLGVTALDDQLDHLVYSDEHGAH